MSVVIVHPDPLIARAMKSLIESEGGFVVNAVSGSLSEIQDSNFADESKVFVVADTVLEETPAELLKGLKSHGSRVAVLCSSETVSTRAATVADTVLSTREDPKDLFARLETLGAKKKGMYVSEHGAAYLGVKLSKREQTAAGYVAKGMSNRDIADVMHVSEQSVKNYLRRLMRKLDCKNRVQLLLKLSGGKVG